MKKMSFELYRLITRLVKEFLNKKYWSCFNSSNFFCISDEKQDIITCFVDNFGNEVYGIPIYYNDDGFNVLHDIMTVQNSEAVSLGDHDCINIMVVRKNKLLEEEIDYIKEAKMRIKEDVNVVIRTYKTGYASRISNEKEGDIAFKTLCYLRNILKKNINDLSIAFNNDLSCFALFDNDNYQYTIKYKPLPLIESFKNPSKVDDRVYDDLKSLERNDGEFYLWTRYILTPVRSVENREIILPTLALYTSLDNGIKQMNGIVASPKKISQNILGFVQMVFEKYGIPSKLFINNRKNYSHLKKLLEKLGVEVIFQREKETIDSFMNNIDLTTTNMLSFSINDGYFTPYIANDFYNIFKAAEDIVNIDYKRMPLSDIIIESSDKDEKKDDEDKEVIEFENLIS